MPNLVKFSTPQGIDDVFTTAEKILPIFKDYAMKKMKDLETAVHEEIRNTKPNLILHTEVLRLTLKKKHSPRATEQHYHN